ncbi:MAG: ABC transporter ATP-binding protein [Prolixibacteraceae bacterium]|nr:ABC transporter ATP-binding protein [Prolixibacteraceae bacterium]
MLELKNLSKFYGNVKAVNQVNLTISKGEFFCLLGPSGCGKTTILRMVAGFEKVTEGNIYLEGKDITNDAPNNRDVNTVFQNYALFPNLSVWENIAYGLKIRKITKDECNRRVEDVVRLTGLSGFEKRMPSKLSGGQQQRVALARALVNRPSILLLDEPLSALDKKIAEQTRNELSELQRKVGITFIFVTHNQTEALALADRIAVMKDGIIEHCDQPKEIYEKPRTHFVADFIGSMNFFECTIKASEDKATLLEIPEIGDVILTGQNKQEAGKTVQFCVRPERMKISMLQPAEYENCIKGVIRQKTYLGEITKFVVELAGNRQISIMAQNYLLKLSNEFYDIGEEVNIIWSKTSGEIIHV